LYSYTPEDYDYLDFLESKDVNTDHFRTYHLSDYKAESLGLPKIRSGYAGWTEFEAINQTKKPMSEQELLDQALDRVVGFQSLDHDVREELLTAGRLIHVEDGEILWEKGDLNDKVYILVGGEFSVTCQDYDDPKFFQEGIFGEESMWGSEKNTWAISSGSSDVLELSASVMRSILDGTGAIEQRQGIQGIRQLGQSAMDASVWGGLPERVKDELYLIAGTRVFDSGDSVILRGDAKKEVYMVYTKAMLLIKVVFKWFLSDVLVLSMIVVLV